MTEKPRVEYVSATAAKKEFSLDESDLQKLEVRYATNPHYKSGPPMRLFVKAEVIKASQARAEQEERLLAAKRKYEEEHAEEIQAENERIRAQKAARKASQQAAYTAERSSKKQAEAWEAQKIMEKWNSRTDRQFAEANQYLNQDLWIKILCMVCDIELQGAKNIETAACDLENAQLVCKEIYNSVGPAFTYLAKFCEPLDESFESWEKLRIDPNSLKLPQLKALAKVLKVKVSDPKPTLIVNLYAALGVKNPTQIPARVLVHIKTDREENKRREIEEEIRAYELERQCVSCGETAALACPWHQCCHC